MFNDDMSFAMHIYILFWKCKLNLSIIHVQIYFIIQRKYIHYLEANVKLNKMHILQLVFHAH